MSEHYTDEEWLYLQAFFALGRLMSIYGYTEKANVGAIPEANALLMGRAGLDDIDGVMKAIVALVSKHGSVTRKPSS